MHISLRAFRCPVGRHGAILEVLSDLSLFSERISLEPRIHQRFTLLGSTLNNEQTNQFTMTYSIRLSW